MSVNISRLIGNRGEWVQITEESPNLINEIINSTYNLTDKKILKSVDKLKTIPLDDFDGVFIYLGLGPLLLYNKFTKQFSLIETDALEKIESSDIRQYTQISHTLINQFQHREIILNSGLTCHTSFVIFDNNIYVRTTFRDIDSFWFITQRVMIGSISFSKVELLSLVLTPLLTLAAVLTNEKAWVLCIAILAMMNVFNLTFKSDAVIEFFEMKHDPIKTYTFIIGYFGTLLIPLFSFNIYPPVLFFNLAIFLGFRVFYQYLWKKNTKRYLSIISNAKVD